MKKLTRRSFVQGSGLLAAMPLLPGSGFAQGARTMTAGTWGGHDQFLRPFIADFESKQNATVRVELGVGATFISKLIASPNRSPYDVVGLYEDEAILGASAELWAPDQSAHLKNFKAQYDTTKPPALPFYPTFATEFPVVYNPTKMKAPESYHDLWTQPNITVGVPNIQNSYGLIFLYISALINGGSADNLGPGFEAIRKLPKFKIFRGVVDGFSMFQRGEIDAGIFHSHRGRQLQDQGVSVRSARPKEGVWGLIAGYQMPKRAQNVELARGFLDMMMSNELQTNFADNFFGPTNRDVALSDELVEKRGIIYGARNVTALKSVPWDRINPQRDKLIERWNKEITA
jgi:putative spermidine/putrescine transport system substrate-binding protein